MSKHLTPLAVVERMISPAPSLGLLLGLNEKAAYAWRRASQYRDAGDMPPRVNRKLLAYAAKHGIPLTAEHLVNGATEREIDVLLNGMEGVPLAKRVAAE